MTDKPEGASLLELLSKATGLVAVLAFALSVVYDWAYLDALGLSFKAVPTSISDHVRTGLIWLPTSIAFVGISFAVGFFMPRRAPSAGTSSEAAERRSPGLWRLVDGWLPPFGVLALIMIGFIAFGGPPLLLYLALALSFMAVASHLHDRWRPLGLQPPTRALILSIPIVVLWVSAWGAVRAEGDRLDSRPTAIFRVIGAEGTIRMRPIRHFERVVLAIDEQANLRVMRSEDLLSVEDFPRPYYYSGAICQIFGAMCYPIPPTVGQKRQ